MHTWVGDRLLHVRQHAHQVERGALAVAWRAEHAEQRHVHCLSGQLLVHRPQPVHLVCRDIYNLACIGGQLHNRLY